MTLSVLTNPLSIQSRTAIREFSYKALEKGIETCGFVLKDGSVIETPNEADSPALEFVIPAEESAKYLDDALCVWHTHLKSPQFSPEDVSACKALNLPWVMHCSRDNTFHWLDPSQDAGLIQRPWAWGLYDCYALVRDCFHQLYGIQLNDYERRFEGVWQEEDFQEFEDHWQEEGFEPITGVPRDGDVLLFNIRNASINHVGVLVDVNQNIFAHHGANRFSEQAILAWDGFWGSKVKQIVRHRDLA